ncbi:MAG: MucBP domain-containing protein [Clostridia bacterium]|nr:MucBP domain-containing protein [Clostridia bacterium]
MATQTKEITLYAENNYYENYEVKTQDIYDANSNGNLEEYVGKSTCKMQFIAPTGLITYQIATDYDDEQEDEITVAPKIAEVKKEQRTAQINVEAINNYSSTISDAQILGKIPFEGNTYVITGENLGSQFTTNITGKIVLDTAKNNSENFSEQRLNELKNNIKIYYSTNENPNRNLEDAGNGWIEESKVTNWSEIKTYYIDFGNFIINKGDDISFKYIIAIPEEIDYEKVSYSAHAVYFNLDTQDGKLADYTEPNKLGIRITRKYNLSIEKNILGTTTPVQNAVYLLESGNNNDSTYESYIERTNSNGKIQLSELHVGRVYKLTEIKSTDDYEISNGTLEFKVVENEQTKVLELQVITEGAGYKTNNVKSNTVNIKVQDRVRYDINLIKFRTGTDTKVKDATYLITSEVSGESGYEAYRKTTNEEGKISLDNLYLDKTYTIEEVLTSENYALSKGNLQFKVTQSEENGNLSVEILNSGAGYKNYLVNQSSNLVTLNVEDEVRYKLVLNKKDETSKENLSGIKYQVVGDEIYETVLTDKDGNIAVSRLEIGKKYTVTEISALGYYINEPFEIYITKDAEGNLKPNIGTIIDNKTNVTLNVNVTNEKIPTYDLDIIKVEKDNKEKTLPNVTFTITGKDLEEKLTTDENGKISLQGLYKYIEGKTEVDGIYTIKETIPADGYILESDVLKIRVSKNGDNLKVDVLEGENFILNTNNGKDIEITSNKVTITLQNNPVFKITKIDGQTSKAIPNTKFAIYKITYNEDGSIKSVEEAKDVNGNIIGEEETINDKTYHIIKTDENGEITADLLAGLYYIEEVEAADGYILPEKQEDRIHYFGIGESKEEKTEFRVISEDTLTAEYSYYNDVQEVEDGYYVIGTLNNECTVELSNGSTKNIYGGCIVKYDKTGKNILWCVNCENLGAIYDSITTPDGDIIVIGAFMVERYDRDGNLVFSKSVDIFGKDIYFTSFGLNNKLIKTSRGYLLSGEIGLENEEEVITINTIDQQEKLVFSGKFVSEFDFDGNTLLYYNEKDEEYNQYYTRYEAGVVEKNNYTETYWFEEETSITTEKQGNIQVKGATVISLDENGNYEWAYSVNSEKITLSKAIKQSDGRVIAVGIVGDSETLNIDGKEYNLEYGGLLIEFNKSGIIENIEKDYTPAYFYEFIQDLQDRYVGVGYNENNMPILQIICKTQINPEFEEMKDITIKNEIKQFKITTEVKQGKGTISGEGQDLYEIVTYKHDSTLPIKATPDEGWKVNKITVNGEIVDYTIADDGSITLPQFTEMKEDKHIVVWFAKLDDYNFELTKTNEDGTPLAGAKFTLKKQDSYNDNKFKDVYDEDGYPIAKPEIINGETMLVVTSDFEGKIKLNLESGVYKLEEVQAPEGYMLPASEVERTNTIRIPIYEINYIEDLIEFSDSLISHTYENETVVLKRTLDFNDASSYRNPNRIYDYNGDGKWYEIKDELTSRDGSGFRPIGAGRVFKGTFNGNGYEIKNLYMKSDNSNSGFFANVYCGVVENLRLTGININTTGSEFNVGGIVGNMQDGKIINCSISGSISVNSLVNVNIVLIGGIVGGINGGEIIECNSNISIKTITDVNAYIGGIVGNAYKSTINKCYNTGSITGRTGTYIGGLIGDGSELKIVNSYNAGDIKYVTNNRATRYGGIASALSRSDIINCYNLGAIQNLGTVECRADALVSSSNDNYVNNFYTIGKTKTATAYSNDENVYYLSDSTSSSYSNGSAISKSKTYMQSKEFVDLLNSNIENIDYDIELLEWTYVINDYPTLQLGINENIEIETAYSEAIIPISITNEKLKYKITTEIAKNSEGSRTGGTITGEYDSKYCSSRNIKFVECVQPGNNNETPIVMMPSEGYGITNISINGENINYTVEDDGTYTIPSGYFTEMKEDKHIIVTYERAEKILTINKVDESDNTKMLSGAKFKIKQIDERAEVTDEVGNLNANGTSYTEIDKEKEVNIEGTLTQNGAEYITVDKENELTNVLGELTNNGTYYFEESNGKYIPNNIGVSGSQANSYIKIDLSDKDGLYAVVVNVEGTSSGLLFGTVNQSTNAPSYNSSEDFIYASGPQIAKDYTYTELKGGNIYYLHLGYMGSVGTSSISISSVKLYEAKGTRYYFEDVDGQYVPNNQGQYDKVANSYIPIDLTNETGKFYLVINAEAVMSDMGYLYATITDNTEAPVYSNSEGRFVYITTSKSAADYSTLLEGGKKYYLHFGYNNLKPDTNIVKINSINMYEAKYLTYYFEEKDGKLVSNNQGKNSTVANSYIPIDLTKTTGKYNLKINAEISSDLFDYGYATITTTQDAPSYSSSTGRILRISGEQEAKDYTKVLDAGNMYYLHLGYYKNSSNSKDADTFTINSIELSLNTDGFYSNELETNKYGQIKQKVPLGNYEITELEAPEGYKLNNETVEFRVVEESDNTITIANKKMSRIIVHHYLKTSDGTKTRIKVAEDETKEDTIGEEYITSPQKGISGLTLEKDEDGGYVLPENAVGTFQEEIVEVIYYYEPSQITLTVNHYLDGTETKLAEDEKYTFNAEAVVKDDGTYEIVTEGNYDIDSNKSYNELISNYICTRVISDVKDETTLEDNLTFNKDTVVTYYYKIKEHVITTRVEIPEGQTKKGGQISGEDLKPYETVQHGKDSKEELKMTPDKGYRINKITINAKNGDELISSQEVLFTPNEDGTYELPKFKEVTNDFEIVVQFVPDIGRVIVHHYIQGTEIKIAPNEITQDAIGTVVNTKEVDTSKYNLVENSEKYVLVQAPEEKDVTIEREDKEVTYYYQAQYKITTNVIPYDERQTDGTIKSVRGGNIFGEDEAPYEEVLKGKNSLKEIKAVPDEGFVITGMKINGQTYDYTKKLANDGTVTLDKFTNMQEDKHIEVEFRRVTKVVVQHILRNPDGTTTLYLETEEDGYVGKDYTSSRINITNYRASEDEEGKIVPSNKEGLMEVDTIYVKYYYEKIPAGITVKHVEKVLKKEKVEVTDEETGETKEEIKTSLVGEPIDGIEDEYIKGYVGEDEITYRKEIEGYVSTSPIEPEEVIENLINVKQEENQITVTYKENDVIEIVYWYEREYKITTDVKEHEEQVKNAETGKEETVLVKGGSITGELTKENTNPLEQVLRGRNSTKEIKIEPEYGYRIKSVTLKNGENEEEKMYIEDFIQEDRKTVIIPVGYFEYMQADKHIEVEFEKIPAKVIVKYLDVVTKEELLPDKETDGFVKDSYDEPRVDVDTYTKADPEPENSKGEMTEDTITIIYYYQKQYKITTDVKEHEELEKKPLVDVIVKKDEEDGNTPEKDNTDNEQNNNTGSEGNNNTSEDNEPNKPTEKKIMVKGGSITGEDELPYEVVTRGEDNIKVIEMKPDYGYRIKSLSIQDGEEVTEIYIDNILTKEGAIIIPEGYFENMQADKHVVVEYEPIPAKVIVQYLEKETEEKIADSEKGEGFVDYEYKTYPKEIPYYELIEEELPENAEGKLVEKDTIVKYYYKKSPFNMKVEKEISKITLDGELVEVKDKNKVKVELEGENVNERKLEISYIVRVTNTEKVEGKAIIEEHIPEGFSFVKEKSSENWKEENGIYTIKTKELQPGETIEYEVTLKWNASKENSGNKVNIVKIANTENVPEYEETTLEDNEDNATLEIKVKVNMPKTGQARIIYIISGLVIATCITMVIWDKKKNRK